MIAVHWKGTLKATGNRVLTGGPHAYLAMTARVVELVEIMAGSIRSSRQGTQLGAERRRGSECRCLLETASYLLVRQGPNGDGGG